MNKKGRHTHFLKHYLIKFYCISKGRHFYPIPLLVLCEI